MSLRNDWLVSILRLHLQFSAFFLVGLATIATHYSLLIALVQGFHVAPVPATPGTLCRWNLSAQSWKVLSSWRLCWPLLSTSAY